MSSIINELNKYWDMVHPFKLSIEIYPEEIDEVREWCLLHHCSFDFYYALGKKNFYKIKED